MSLRRLRAAMHPNHDPPDRRPDVTRPPAKSRLSFGRATKCRRKPHQEVDVNLSKRLGVAEGAQPAHSGESWRRIGWVWGYRGLCSSRTTDSDDVCLARAPDGRTHRRRLPSSLTLRLDRARSGPRAHG